MLTLWGCLALLSGSIGSQRRSARYMRNPPGSSAGSFSCIKCATSLSRNLWTGYRPVLQKKQSQHIRKEDVPALIRQNIARFEKMQFGAAEKLY